MSGDSKGGHSHKGDYEKRPPKTMVEFEGSLIDVFDLKRVDVDMRQSDTAAEGATYALIIRLGSHPYEKVYHYGSEQLREDAKNKLKMQLMIVGVNII